MTMRETGAVLKEIRFADCAHGPHENRGCIRNDLVKALGDALPAGTIRFNCSVSSIRVTDAGARARHLLLEAHFAAACSCMCLPEVVFA